MFRVKGPVIKGKQQGRKLGFPTANLGVKNRPESGIYAGKVILDGREYEAAIFVPQEGNFIEAHILNFSQDLYGKEIEISIEKKIREVKKFENDEELRAQIKNDLETIRG